MTLLVASETRFTRGGDGRVYSATGVDGYAFWSRYLRVFDRLVIAARTAAGSIGEAGSVVNGPGVEIVPLPAYHGAWGYALARPQLVLTLRQAIARADVLCLRAPGPIAGWAFALRDGRPFGVEVVGDPLDALAPGAVRSVVRPIARARMARELKRMCREAVAVAYVTQAALQARYPTAAWSTAYSSIDLGDEAFVAEEAIARRGWGGDGRPWRLVFVGSLSQLYKGQDLLLAAVAQCAARGLALELTIVGDGAYRAALEQRARALGLAAAVRFAGNVPAGAAVRDLLERADLFVLPSRTEGLPRAMIEAMARGLPCLGTRVGGIPELLDDAQLVPAGDAGVLADALVRLLGSPALLAACAQRNLAHAGQYRRAVLASRRRAFYERLRAAASGGGVHPSRAAGAGAAS